MCLMFCMYYVCLCLASHKRGGGNFLFIYIYLFTAFTHIGYAIIYISVYCIYTYGLCYYIYIHMLTEFTHFCYAIHLLFSLILLMQGLNYACMNSRKTINLLLLHYGWVTLQVPSYWTRHNFCFSRLQPSPNWHVASLSKKHIKIK